MKKLSILFFAVSLCACAGLGEKQGERSIASASSITLSDRTLKEIYTQIRSEVIYENFASECKNRYSNDKFAKMFDAYEFNLFKKVYANFYEMKNGLKSNGIDLSIEVDPALGNCLLGPWSLTFNPGVNLVMDDLGGLVLSELKKNEAKVKKITIRHTSLLSNDELMRINEKEFDRVESSKEKVDEVVIKVNPIPIFSGVIGFYAEASLLSGIIDFSKPKVKELKPYSPTTFFK